MKKYLILFILLATVSLSAQIYINEFSPKGTEWVELYNAGSSYVDLSNWLLYSIEDGDSFTILPGTAIVAGGFTLLTGIGYIMDNDGDTLYLENSTGTVINWVAFGNLGPAPLAHTNWSIARPTDGLNTGNMAMDFNIDGTPTPGAPNDAAPAPLNALVILNEIDPYPTGTGDSLEFFNPSPTDEVIMDGWLLSDGDGVGVIGTCTIPPYGFHVIITNDIGVSFASADVAYLFAADTSRIDQLGYYGEYNDYSFQRIPNGCAPHDGYDWISSGGGNVLFDTTETFGYPNGWDSVTLTYPTGGEVFTVGEDITIGWTGVADSVTIVYSYNNWFTFDTIATGVTTVYSWTVPGTPSTQCQLAIMSSLDPVFYDNTDSMFTIICGGQLSCDSITYWSGDIDQGLNYGDPPEWMGMGVLFTPTEIGAYAGDYINRIIFQLRDGNNPADDGMLYILGDTISDTLYSMPFTVTGDSGWYELYLSDSIYIDGTDMWILAGFTYETGVFPFGCNAQSFFAQKNDWAWTNTGGWEYLSAYGFDIGWPVAALICSPLAVEEEILIGANPFTIRAINPVGRQPSIYFSTPIEVDVSVDIFDISGRKVVNLFDGRMQGSTTFNFISEATGSYVYRVTAAGRTFSGKVIVVH